MAFACSFTGLRHGCAFALVTGVHRVQTETEMEASSHVLRLVPAPQSRPGEEPGGGRQRQGLQKAHASQVILLSARGEGDGPSRRSSPSCQLQPLGATGCLETAAPDFVMTRS